MPCLLLSYMHYYDTVHVQSLCKIQVHCKNMKAEYQKVPYLKSSDWRSLTARKISPVKLKYKQTQVQLLKMLVKIHHFKLHGYSLTLQNVYCYVCLRTCIYNVQLTSLYIHVHCTLPSPYTCILKFFSRNCINIGRMHFPCIILHAL